MDDHGQVKRAYTYQGTVQAGKFSAVKPDSTITNEGFVLPAAGDNYGVEILGILEEGIVPPGIGASDYIAGSYEGVSQASWPTNIGPTTPQGNFRRTVVIGGPIRARNGVAGGWSRGDRLVAVDDLGHLGSVVTLGLAQGTRIFTVAIADEPTVNQNDVAQVIVQPHWDIV